MTLTRLAAGGGSSCALAPPVPSLPSRLRSLGGFDQPQDPSDSASLEAFAAQAATSVAPSLIGTVPRPPVRIASIQPGRPDALVVPLLSSRPAGQPTVVAGLVAFLEDCSGRAYYSAVDDLTLRSATAPQAFPAETRAAAAAALHTNNPELAYGKSPFAPVWRDRDTGATVAAFAMP